MVKVLRKPNFNSPVSKLYLPIEKSTEFLGYEFEKNENLLVKRFGIEYILELNENIDISPAYIFDSMGESHGSHTFAFTIGYHFNHLLKKVFLNFRCS